MILLSLVLHKLYVVFKFHKQDYNVIYNLSCRIFIVYMSYFRNVFALYRKVQKLGAVEIGGRKGAEASFACNRRGQHLFDVGRGIRVS